jgi:phosphohistidine phosphatase
MATRDEDRQLTNTGRDEVKAVAAVLASRLLDRIYVSPYIRAQQSARIAAEQIGFAGDMVTVPWLTPDTPANKAFGNMSADGEVLFVAHQPLLGALCSLLVHGDARRAFSLRTAALVELEGEALFAGGMHLIAIH